MSHSSVHFGCFFGSGAKTAEEEGEHSDDLGNNESDSHVVVILHVPEKSITGSSDDRLSAEGRVLAEEKSEGGDDDGELEEAGEEVAVDLEDSNVGSPSADEHENSLNLDEEEGEGVEEVNDGQLGTLGLAIDITVVDDLSDVLHEVVEDVIFPVDLLAGVDISGGLDVGAPVNNA